MNTVQRTHFLYYWIWLFFNKPISELNEDVCWLYAWLRWHISNEFPCYWAPEYSFSWIASCFLATKKNQFNKAEILKKNSPHVCLKNYFDSLSNLFPSAMYALLSWQSLWTRNYFFNHNSVMFNDPWSLPRNNNKYKNKMILLAYTLSRVYSSVYDYSLKYTLYWTTLLLYYVSLTSYKLSLVRV